MRQTSLAIVLCAMGAAPAWSAQVYFTNFPKTANINNNLHKDYPGTGFTVAGSVSGNPNASFLFDPATYSPASSPPGDNLANNGVKFNITSDANGRDYAEVSNVNAGAPVIIPMGGGSYASVHTLTAAYFGVATSFTFTSNLGTTQTFNPVGIPDFNNGGPLNTTASGALDQSVLQVSGVGGGGTGNSTTGNNGNYFLYEQSFPLNAALVNEGLASMTITPLQYTPLLFGITAVQSPEPTTLATLCLAGCMLTRRRGGR